MSSKQSDFSSSPDMVVKEGGVWSNRSLKSSTRPLSCPESDRTDAVVREQPILSISCLLQWYYSPVNPPLYENDLHQQRYNTAAYTDGSDLLPQIPNYGSVPAQRQKKGSQTLKISFGFFLLAAISLTIVAFYFYPRQLDVHDRIRREWEAEERAHQVMRDAWDSEHQAMVVERGSWQKERAGYILEREAISAERDQWRRERTDRENRERQEEEEKRALIVWQDLKASTQCLRYGTREYSATLAHVSLGMDPLKECWKKSIDIHGRQIFPSRCDTQVCFFLQNPYHPIFDLEIYQGMCGTVTGHWIVDFDEPSCVTWWRGYDNKVLFDIFSPTIIFR